MCFLLPTLCYEVGHSHDCDMECGCEYVGTVSFVLCVQTFSLCFYFF